MLEVIKPGLETSVQDWPGRYGYLNVGFPWSGPMDSWSFRLANVLVGNAPGDAGLECQFIGPSLRFQRATVIALTGADMQAKLDDVLVPLWQSVAVAAGQTLVMGSARTGARGYLAIAGGIRNPAFFGSRATFNKGGLGGIKGTPSRLARSFPSVKDRVRQADGCASRRAQRLPPTSAGRSRWLQAPTTTG